MKATELYNLLEQNKEKLTLIDRIQEFQASRGHDLEWILELVGRPYYMLQNIIDEKKELKP